MGWKNYTWTFEGIEKQLERLNEKKAVLDKLRPLSSAALRNLRESLAVEWTYNSNSIEGNTLSLQETKIVIEDGMTVHGKSMREHFEALNHQEAIAYIESLVAVDYQLKDKDILQIHAYVLQRIEKEFAGRYRNAGVRISGANFVPPNALKVDEYMNELITWYNEESAVLHPVVAASIFHHRFVWIHPFFDGNGRTVRLISNLLLMNHGFPPAIILKNDRKKYYDALNKANNENYSKIVLLMIQALERTLDIYLGNLTNTYDDYKPISNIVEEPGVPYGQEYVSLLARQGKIDAFKEGRNWLTTKQAIFNYIDQRERIRDLSRQ